MGDSSETPTFPSDTNMQTLTENIDLNSQSDSAIEKNLEKSTEKLTEINSLDDDKYEIESSNDLKTTQLNDADLTANSIVSDQAIKLKSKLLESETEQRNTSTSNAGESEYESANEEDIADFENTPDAELSTVPSNSVNVNADTSSNAKFESQSANSNAEGLNETFDKLESDGDYNNVSKLNNETVSSLNEVDEELVEQQVLRIRRRKRRSKLSDNENVDEDDFEEGSDEEETEDIEDEEDSYDEAEEGEIVLSKSLEDINAKILPDDERENGDGQESENQDGKSSKAAQSSKVAKKSETEDKRNPQYIPRKGPFYEHDDRLNEIKSVAKSQEPTKTTTESEEGDTEKMKSKKRLMASMKLRSDEMIDDDLEIEQLSSKSLSKEKIHDLSSQSVESLEKVVNNVKVDSKSPREPRKKPLWDSKDRWSHDKFNDDDQKPKSREELISIYGYDIRNENDAPKLQRRSKYGKGPQKYSRRSEDENAYAKKALRKVIRPSRNSISEDFKETDLNNSVVKKDQVFNNRHFSREHKPISKENVSSRPVNSKPSFADTPNRVHENRVFVNKQSGPSPKYSKHDKPRSIPEPFKESSSENIELRRENINEQDINDRPKELFTNEDFPELVSSAKTQVNVDQSKNSKGVIYYQNSIAPTKSNEIKSNKDTHQSINPINDLKESNFNSDNTKPNQSLPVVKSQLYENSRFSRSRNYPPNHEYSANWNSRPISSNKSQPQISSNHQIKKQLTSANANKDDVSLNETNETNNNDSRPKRYSSIRQQQQRSLTVPSNSISATQSSTFTSVSQTSATASPQQQPQQYITLNSDGNSSNTITPEVTTKNSYYDPPTITNDISHGQSPGLIPNATSHHHAHSYATINGPTTGGAATGTAYIPAAAPLMAYYDPNAASGQPTGTTTPALQAPIGLTQAYFTTDQTGTAQPAPNYYLTTADHLTAVAYHPAYHLQANYPPPLTSHHTHQSHVANRYLNTAPANAPSAESNRYLQTTPSTPNSTSILVAGQAYQPTIQTAFPSGYPQFPPPQTGTTPAIGTSSPLPAGYPNVPMANSSTNAPVNVASTQQPTPSGYPELYRGGITYYDIQSQQQAMQRQLQQNITQQSRRGKNVNHHSGTNDIDHSDTTDVSVDVTGKNSKHSAAKNEISVSN